MTNIWKKIPSIIFIGISTNIRKEIPSITFTGVTTNIRKKIPSITFTGIKTNIRKNTVNYLYWDNDQHTKEIPSIIFIGIMTNIRKNIGDMRTFDKRKICKLSVWLMKVCRKSTRFCKRFRQNPLGLVQDLRESTPLGKSFARIHSAFDKRFARIHSAFDNHLRESTRLSIKGLRESTRLGETFARIHPDFDKRFARIHSAFDKIFNKSSPESTGLYNEWRLWARHTGDDIFDDKKVNARCLFFFRNLRLDTMIGKDRTDGIWSNKTLGDRCNHVWIDIVYMLCMH